MLEAIYDYNGASYSWSQLTDVSDEGYLEQGPKWRGEFWEDHGVPQVEQESQFVIETIEENSGNDCSQVNSDDYNFYHL